MREGRTERGKGAREGGRTGKGREGEREGGKKMEGSGEQKGGRGGKRALGVKLNGITHVRVLCTAREAHHSKETIAVILWFSLCFALLKSRFPNALLSFIICSVGSGLTFNFNFSKTGVNFFCSLVLTQIQIHFQNLNKISRWLTNDEF